ncbi:MAG: DUF3450 family protein [Verrucomicrobiota bacterium]|nr:DUF3450 family protein [Verrucomicrobiota bacterium]
MVSIRLYALLLLSLIIKTDYYSQELVSEGDTIKVSPSAALQEKVRQWVDVQKQRSEETARWQEQQQQLATLNELRRTEIKQIDTLIAAAGQRLEEATTQQRKLQEEQAELSSRRSFLLENITELEKAMRECIARFPTPLREKVEDAIYRLDNPDDDRPLQDRYRDVLAILTASIAFDNAITVTREIREVEGKRIELETIYMGLTKAWYVGRGDTIAGHGKATNEGWQWQPDNSISGQVRRAIDIYRKESSPGYVKLPF